MKKLNGLLIWLINIIDKMTIKSRWGFRLHLDIFSIAVGIYQGSQSGLVHTYHGKSSFKARRGTGLADNDASLAEVNNDEFLKWLTRLLINGNI